MRVLIVGAGGHAQVVVDAIWQMRATGFDVTPVAYVDDNHALHGREILGVPVAGDISNRGGLEHDAIVVAIGDNRARAAQFASFKESGAVFATVCHPAAVVAPDVPVGPGCMILAGAIVNTGSALAENIILNTGCTVDHHAQIGSHVHVAPGAHLGGEVVLGEGVLVGIGATVMPRCRIAAWSTAGAGSLVNRDVPANTVVVGVPAHMLDPWRKA
jgi:sugar O-acyltransferase (sialic acid O-acetyltransferase NeuD family)